MVKPKQTREKKTNVRYKITEIKKKNRKSTKIINTSKTHSWRK